MIELSKRRALFSGSVGFTAFALGFVLYRTRGDGDPVPRVAAVAALVCLALMLVLELRPRRR